MPAAVLLVFLVREAHHPASVFVCSICRQAKLQLLAEHRLGVAELR
jgi:hydrogenase maturation factor